MKDMLKVVGFHEARHVEPAVKDLNGNIVELAMGELVSKMFLRTPSGKVYVVRVPSEMLAEFTTQ
jgi:hypothetical protein